jgi:hypothetical protein
MAQRAKLTKTSRRFILIKMIEESNLRDGIL